MKKKRYTLNEVNDMFKAKYPYGYVNGGKEVEKILSVEWGYKYRIGYDYQFKTLIDIIEKLNLEE